MTNMHVKVYKDRAGQWRWTLYARNGRKIATCGEGYKNRKHATKMVRRLFGIVI